MKRLAYLTLVVELIVVGVAAWLWATPGCGGMVDVSAIRAVGFWCSANVYLTALFGSLLVVVTLGYIVALHVNPNPPLLRKVASVERTVAVRRLQWVCAACVIGTGAFFLSLEFPPKWTSVPEISNWNSLKISLERGGCLGRCPMYRVEILGDGTVIYSGSSFVAVAGRQERRIPTSTVRELFEQFRRTNYFAFSDKYVMMGFDAPTYVTSIEFDGRSKSVVNFGGDLTGMPRTVTDLENAIDHAANTDEWVNGG